MTVPRNQYSSLANTVEALDALRAIGSAAWKQAVPGVEHCFLYDMFDKVARYGEKLVVSGKQLERLRRIRAEMVVRGLLSD